MSKFNRFIAVWFLSMALFGCGAGGTTTGTSSGTTDATPPTVSSCNPSSSAINVPFSASITATFSEAMKASAVNGATFTLKAGLTNIAGSVLYNATSNTATFTPSNNLANNMTYTATITTGVQDLAGNALSSNYTWSFTTVVFAIPDTGQTGDYTATFGEDSDYEINPMSFTNNLDGTTTDNVTSMMWQQQDDGTTRIWDYAMTYCSGLSLGGHTDWRLPARMELMSILNDGTYSPSINTAYFPNTKSSYYWSSTFFASTTSNAWTVSFNDGLSSYGDRTSTNYYVRCVRGAQTTPSYTDNGNGTITDNVTSLMWQKQDDGTAWAWADALTYCEGLTLGGHSDWRLPNIKELSSLVDDTRHSPAIDPIFTSTQLSNYWSSTTYASNLSVALLVAFQDGNVSYGNKTSGFYVRCVR